MFLQSKAVCVPGEGTRDATIVLLGEGLGEEEERLLRPFVGRAGWMLDKCLFEAGLLREEVFITNSARCRPVRTMPDGYRKNRTPTADELAYCHGWLDDELAQLTNKRVIVALGKSATWAALAQEDTAAPNLVPTGGVTENQGKVVWSERYQCWVVLTLHPAYVLRAPAEAFWLTMDLMMAKGIVERGAPPESKPAEHVVIRTLDEAVAMRDEILRQSGRLSFDWETDGVHLTKSQGFCVAFCSDHRPAFAWVVPRYGSNFTPYWSRRDLPVLDREVLQPLFTSDIPKIGHNLPFDMSVTETTIGVAVVNPDGDTQVLHHLVKNHLGERAHGLKRLSVLYSPYGRYDDELDRWLMANGHVKDGKPDGAYIYKAPNSIVHPYNGTDAVVPMVVEPILNQQVRDADLWDVYREERLPFVFMYKELDRAGVRIDAQRLTTMSAEIATVADRTAQRISQVAGYVINPSSHQQVAEYVYEKRGLPVLGYTENGNPSTKEEHLVQLAHLDPAIPLMLHHRIYTKTRGTWLAGSKKDPGGLMAALDADGRARMNTITCAVETFRLATRKPFPVHTIPRPLVLWSCQREPAAENHGFYLFEPCCEHVKREVLSIRSLLVPDPGCKLVQVDYVQQEYALAAIASGQTDMEEAMLDRREDAHEFVMTMVGRRSRSEFGEWTKTMLPRDPEKDFVFYGPEAEIEYKNLRSDWKRINFLILYRGGEKKLSRSLTTRDPQHPDDPVKNRTVDEAEAAGIIQMYYERLPMIRQWQYNTVMALRRTGRVVGLFKTYRLLPGIWSPDKWDQWDAERQACNFPFQNGGYHVLARAMIKIYRAWRGNPPLKAPFPGRLLFSVHDEVVAQVRADLAEEGAAQMQRLMEEPHDELVGGCGIRRGILTDRKIVDAWGGLIESPRSAA